jgi:hypothetical protein
VKIIKILASYLTYMAFLITFFIIILAVYINLALLNVEPFILLIYITSALISYVSIVVFLSKHYLKNQRKGVIK